MGDMKGLLWGFAELRIILKDLIVAATTLLTRAVRSAGGSDPNAPYCTLWDLCRCKVTDRTICWVLSRTVCDG